MSVDYRAVIIVGYPYADIIEKIKSVMDDTEYDGDVYEWIEENNLEWVGPYYDCSLEDSLVGVVVQTTSSYQWKEFKYSPSDYLEQTLGSLFGVRPKIYFTPQGW